MDNRDVMTKIAEYAFKEIDFFIEDLKGASVASYPDDAGSFENWLDILEKMRYSLYEVANNYPEEEQYFEHVGPMVTEELENGGKLVVDTGVRFDKEGWTKYKERVQEGLDLFGKYFQSLWI